MEIVRIETGKVGILEDFPIVTEAVDTVVEDMHLIVVQVHSRHSGGLEGDAQTMVENIFKSLSRVRIAAVFARASFIC